LNRPDGNPPITNESLAASLEQCDPDIRALVTSRIPMRLRAEVGIDDVLQLVWMAAFRELPGKVLTGEDALLRWLITVSKRVVADAIRVVHTTKRGGDVPNQEDTSIMEFFHSMVPLEKSPSSVAALSETQAHLRAAINDLDEDHRQAISLRYIDGHPLDSIAVIMDRSSDAVRGLIFRGLRELEEKLGSPGRFLSGDGLGFTNVAGN
jgi:RNA polymerase sigma-70 factor (ECF subfamily)